MDDSRFDTWTRRKFGLATGGAAAVLLGLTGSQEAGAKKKKKCKKLGQSCDASNKNKKCCNSKQLCAQVNHLGGGNFCCKERGSSCSFNEDCCGSDKCNNGSCQNP